MATAIICILILLVCLYSLRKYLKMLITGGSCCGGGDAPKAIRVQDRNVSHYPYQLVMKVGGMSCQHCVIRVENALNEMDGIWATVNLSAEQAMVRCKEKPDLDKLRQAVTGSGYSVLSIEQAASETDGGKRG